MNSKFTLGTFLLSALILLALLVRFGTALAFPNILWADEIFQTQEPAHRLTFGYGVVSWEFRDGARSWVFPGILAGVMRLTAWMGDGSRGYLLGVTIFLCLLSLSTIVVAFLWGYRTSGLVAAVITAAVCSVWFELVYFAPKAFNEVVAAHLLLPGVYLGVHRKPFGSRTRLFWAGCLCGLALALRIQLLPAVAFAVVYICRKDWLGKWLPILAGILAPLLAFGLVDAFTWSYPFQSFWKAIWVNVVEGKSLDYGVSPWYGYLSYLKKSWSLGLVPITFLSIIGARRSPILAWLAIIIVLSHSFLAHKEYRFIYPAVVMVIVLAGLGTAELITQWRQLWSSSKKMVIAILLCLLLWTSISAVLALTSRTIDWSLSTGNLRAFQELSTEKTLCGVALWGIPWHTSAGYTHLHRDVPIFLLENDKDFNQMQASFNYLVGKVPIPPQHQDYVLQRCWKNTCLYQRSGSCIPTSYNINQRLKEQGE